MKSAGLTKIESSLEYLVGRGVGRWSAAPPLFRLMWSLGLRVPPPHFWDGPALFVFMGGSYAVLFGLVMRVITQRWLGLPAFALCGVGFGAAMTAHYRWSARRLRLPPWEELDG